jgi:hypothetical protein
MGDARYRRSPGRHRSRAIIRRVTTSEDGLSCESATALAAERGLGFFQYGDVLSLWCQSCDFTWEPTSPWQASDFVCPNGCLNR